MSERITDKDVDRIAESVSERLAGSVSAYRRNGYLGLDLYDTEGTPIETLHLGTAREVYTYLQGMRRAQLLARVTS